MVPRLTPPAPFGEESCLSSFRASLRLAVGATNTTVLPSLFLIVTEQSPLGPVSSVSSAGSRVYRPTRKLKRIRIQHDRDVVSRDISIVCPQKQRSNPTLRKEKARIIGSPPAADTGNLQRVMSFKADCIAVCCRMLEALSVPARWVWLQGR